MHGDEGAATFAEATAIEGRGEGRFRGTILPGWGTGPSPHGGYVAAIVLRALVAAVDDASRPPRSLTVHFADAAEEGPCELEVTVERAGRSLSTLSARLVQDGRLRVTALAAFAAAGPFPVTFDESEPPEPAAFDPAQTMPWVEGLPEFVKHIELQPTSGGFVATGGPASVGGWLRTRPAEPLDACALTFLADALWPPAYAHLEAPSIVPTIDLTMHFRRALPHGDVDLVNTLFRTRVLEGGFFDEDGTLWAPDGTLLAHSRQLARIIDAEYDRPQT
ncbi:MAG: thioesterase family protein [Actinomycetota bacterium]|nr:thioesterase family protein [Actinomycetota bacterium]